MLSRPKGNSGRFCYESHKLLLCGFPLRLNYGSPYKGLVEGKLAKAKNGKVLLLGDTSIDFYVLHDSPRRERKERSGDRDWMRHTQWASWMLPGGVHMTRDFLSKLVEPDHEVDMFGPDRRNGGTLSRLGSFATLMYVEKKSKDGKDPYVRAAEDRAKAHHKHVRIAAFNGYQDITNTIVGDHPANAYQGIGPHLSLENREYQIEEQIPDGRQYNAIVLNDAGDELRQTAGKGGELVKEAFSLIKELSAAGKLPKFVLLKMHLPLKQGCVWTSFEQSAKENEDLPHIVVVSADDLRAEGVEINHCLSWDAVVDDIAKAVAGRGLVHDLLRPGCHLIVLFDVEAAICLRKTDDGVDWSISFCPPQHEGATTARNAGTLVGKMNCFTAYLCKGILECGSNVTHTTIGEICTLALAGLRSFAVEPMQIEDVDDARLRQLKYPDLDGVLSGRFTHEFALHQLDPIIIDSFEHRPPSHLIDDMMEEKYPAESSKGLAKNVVRYGLKALDDFPVGKFRKLTAVDRSEIESLRAISRLISGYLSNRNETLPLSIAVFGAPGAGKSFSVKQLVDEDEVPICEFNLSEATAEDLPGFFHEIRDFNLTGKTPLCFFDEFDTDGRKLVASFLAPMQDGKFRQGSRIHPTGRGIFVFAGGTSQTFEEFAGQTEQNDPNIAQNVEINRQLKIPDFSSRLRGYLNIGGIDMSAGDTHLLRRAILLRVYLEEHMPSINDQDGEAQVDDAVINAFLECGGYVHGARSMEQIVKMSSRRRTMTRFTLSDLPEDRQLMIHIGDQSFKNLN